MWENKYDITDPAGIACTPDRPANTTTIEDERNSGKLSLMNHMLYWQQAFGIQVPDTRNITNTNSWDGPGGLGTHMLQCSSEVGRQPTFVLVDFFNVGPAMKTVDIFNNVQTPVGRKAVTDEILDGGFRGRKNLRSTTGTLQSSMMATIAVAAMTVVAMG